MTAAPADGGGQPEFEEHEEFEEELPAAPRGRRRFWWPAALAAVVALGLGVPALVSGSTPASGSPTAAAPAAPATDSAEAGFARDMATHHQQAIDMSFIIRDRTQSEEVRGFAFDIINTQANQRGMLMGFLDQWGLSQSTTAKPMTWMNHPYEAHDGSLMPGMATNTELDRLRSLSGQDAEVYYLQLMIKHHKAGAEMAQAYVDAGRNAPEKRLAQGMVDAQHAEIQLMTDMLAERGAQPAA
ncbi:MULTISPECIES: DUF305 domain-containing protein [Kitasatospora]|uniref:DUF305 domain-containing protein n=1 Tax=Kitasatospora TaxID=2063 RepID=UPI002284104F|nr:DUF305 domain-containing protein [Kitasatospora sp. YST-16]WAL71239.1 DUF305 domain-containing protein [Kitasatospora sp. YST-16]WNW37275.1 DUF305 domain-containing protein [Streptomyces sp. Li-HN-5-13]